MEYRTSNEAAFPAALEDVKTAVSEAVTNCIIHGYENEIHTIRLTAALDGDRAELVGPR